MIRFDTSDRKPKLYHLLAETAAVAAVAGVMTLSGIGAVPVSIVLNVFFFSLPIQLMIAFFGQLF